VALRVDVPPKSASAASSVTFRNDPNLKEKEVIFVNATPYFHPQATRLARNRYALLRAVALALVIIVAIGITSGPLSAQNQTGSDNQAGLHSVLDAIAAAA
jgi:hypothetical protein